MFSDVEVTDHVCDVSPERTPICAGSCESAFAVETPLPSKVLPTIGPSIPLNNYFLYITCGKIEYVLLPS